MAVLALLMAGTSWAVASWVSVWLVPPYLILMALLLSPSPSVGRPQGEPAGEGAGSSSLLGPDESDDDDSSSGDPASAESPGDESESGEGAGLASKSPKARRGKARAKKARPLPEPTEATWLQVAPGKFVRVEAPEEGTSSPAGPHDSVGIPVEVPTAPQPLESDGSVPPGPIEDAGSGPFGSPEGAWEGDPTGEVESGSSTDLEGDVTAESSEDSEAALAVDGNAPQAEARSDEPEARRLEVPSESSEDQAEGAEDSSPPAFADVPPEPADEWGAPAEGLDPTEIPVDETDLDDAEPPGGPAPRPVDNSRDADPPATEPLPSDSEDGPPARWSGRLAPLARTRVGHPPLRAVDRGSPPRRLERSPPDARRPPDPRRLDRRGSGRPRQVNRSFPPRSPPVGPVGRWREQGKFPPGPPTDHGLDRRRRMGSTGHPPTLLSGPREQPQCDS